MSSAYEVPNDGEYFCGETEDAIRLHVAGLGSVCGNCRYFREDEPPTYDQTMDVLNLELFAERFAAGNLRVPPFRLEGSCRRMPPQVFAAGSDGEDFHTAWPLVDYGDWCGEYQPRPAESTPPIESQP